MQPEREGDQVGEDVEYGNLKGSVFEGSGNAFHADPTPSPDRLYSLYVDEASKYDDALVERLKTNSDTLLIYAGLFSATVTALLVESYSTLKEDPQDTAVLYLRLVSQQLAAIQNLSNPVPQSPISFAFQPTSSSVRINIFWALSLVVSLACALGATLIQTWTNRYTRLVSQFTNVAHRAQQRHFFFEGIKSSRLVAIAEALPALLHFSLFLFLAGLVEFFLRINNHVGYATLAAVIALSSAYALLTMSPLIFASFPYQTPLTLRVPARLSAFLRQRKLKYTARFTLNPVSRYDQDMDFGFALRQTRALQWALDRMTGASSFDSFVEGIPSFLEAADHDARVIFQLNVGATGEQRRNLAAHIGFRLRSCLDPSVDISARRALVRMTTSALWNLLVRLRSVDAFTDIAPGGTNDREEWHTVAIHFRQWLHPHTLRSLRRLRYDTDPYISVHANCASVMILDHTLRIFCTRIRGEGIAVPGGTGFTQLLSIGDMANTAPAYETSYELDILTTCLLKPPADEIGYASRAEENLEASLTAMEEYAKRDRLSGLDLAVIPESGIKNSCRLQALVLFLECFLTQVAALPATLPIMAMVRQTVNILAADTAAHGTEEILQRNFVALLERIFQSHAPSPLHTNISKALLQEIRSLLAPISRTLDHPVWSQKAYRVAYQVEPFVKVDDVVLSDAQSGILGKIVFDEQPLRSGTTYVLCREGREVVLDLSGFDAETALLYRFHDGSNQKWQLHQDGQYWNLRCLSTGTFLAIGGPAVDGANIVASGRRVRWDIKQSPDDPLKYSIALPDTPYIIAASYYEESAATLTLCPSYNNPGIPWELGRLVFSPPVLPNAEYFITFSGTENVLDLSLGDRKSVINFPLNFGNNQRWRAAQNGEHWTLQNSASGAFLSVEGPVSEGAMVVCSSDAAEWEIRSDGEHIMDYNFFHVRTQYALSLVPNRGISVLLSQSPPHRIRFRFQEADQQRTKAKRMGAHGKHPEISVGATSLKSRAKYIFYCQETNNALDLSGSDRTTILIWEFHGGANQKWLLTECEDFWFLQNMNDGQYLSVQGLAQEGAAVLASGEATKWELRLEKPVQGKRQRDKLIEDTVFTSTGPRYTIFAAGTHYSLAVGDPMDDGAVVTLSGENQARIRWRIEMVQ